MKKKKYFNELEVVYEIEEIENSKPALRLSEKTQVLVPITGRDSIATNRLTHSYEVATSARMIAAHIVKQNQLKLHDIDYKNCFKQVCLLHDIGHPPFGHAGQKIIHDKIIENGLAEGVSDNNNNLVVIETHDIEIRDYIKASIIKYPHKLYNYQKIKYQDILQEAIEEDRVHYSKFGINLYNQRTTIACQIMDEADRNSYTCSDLTDFFTLGNEIEPKKLKNFVSCKTEKESILLNQMIYIIETKDNRKIRKFFSDIKKSFNANFKLTDHGLTHIDQGVFNFRETLSKVTYEFFVKQARTEYYHSINMDMLDTFMEKALHEEFCKSKYYTKKINESKTKIERLTAIRDMVSENSDWFVIKNFANDNKK